MSEVVKIILIATDTKKKSLVFVDENLKVYSLQESILAAQGGSLYSMGKKPHEDPHPNDRGLQIANEFYKLAQDWLK